VASTAARLNVVTPGIRSSKSYRESSRRKEAARGPFVLRSDLVECRVGKAADRSLDRSALTDRIGFDADAVGAESVFGFAGIGTH